MGTSTTGTAYLRYLADSCGVLAVVKDTVELPPPHELQRYLALNPEVVLLEMSEEAVRAGTAKLVRDMSPDSVIIGFGNMLGGPSAATLDAALGENPPLDVFSDALRRSLASNREENWRSLYCFLPTKAGSGASTIVLNIAATMVRKANQRVLVIDSDLRSSALATMVGATPRLSTEQLLGAIGGITASQLSEFLVTWEGVDLLLSKRTFDAAPPNWAQYVQLLALVAPKYDAILVDLPELVNPATIELVRSSKRVFTVCTPEIPSMTLAKQRLEELERLMIPKEKLSPLVNRWHKADLSQAELSEVLGLEVKHLFPNDYGEVRKAIASAKSIAANSRLGAAFQEFAAEFTPAVTTPASFSSKLRNLLRIA